MVLAHPEHALAAAGLIQRLEPQALVLTNADGAFELGTEEVALESFGWLGLESSVTMLGSSESELYEGLLAGDVELFLRLRDRIQEWLTAVSPTIVFADAYETYNAQHDLCGALVDSALVSAGLREIESYELPLACYGDLELAACTVAELENRGLGCQYLELTPAEVERKKKLAYTLAGHHLHLASSVAPLPDERFRFEPFRAVPRDRAYDLPPARAGWQTYDECGLERVRQGKYERPILFADHFVPVARALGVGRQSVVDSVAASR